MIPATDGAIESGNPESLVKLLTGFVHDGVLDHFKEVMERKKFDKNEVEKGREFVKAYVEFVHYVERIYEATKKPAHGHFSESESGELQK